MSNAPAFELATAYPPYDSASAVQTYVDEFGALALAGWTALGIGLALAVRFAPELASPTAASPAVPAPLQAASPILAAVAGLPAPGTLAVLATDVEPLALESTATAKPAARMADPPPTLEGRQMIVTRKEP